jgi:hypothetical protein
VAYRLVVSFAPDSADLMSAGGVLMRQSNGGIHEVQLPNGLIVGIRFGIQCGEDRLPHTRPASAAEAAGEDVDGAKALGLIGPGGTDAPWPADCYSELCSDHS